MLSFFFPVFFLFLSLHPPFPPAVMGIEFRDMCVLTKCSAFGLYPHPPVLFIKGKFHLTYDTWYSSLVFLPFVSLLSMYYFFQKYGCHEIFVCFVPCYFSCVYHGA
jgi:hypothetical protein